MLSKITRRPIPPPISRRENWKVKRRKIRRLPTCLISLLKVLEELEDDEAADGVADEGELQDYELLTSVNN